MSEPLILALEASAEPASVALRLPGGRVLERSSSGEKQSAFLLPAVDALLAESGLEPRDLGLIAVAQGPGAFTGVRFALSVAQGLAFGLGRPTVGISTLAALAREAARAAGLRPGARVLASLDARMDEVYGGSFRIGEDGLPDPEGPEFLAAPGDVPERLGGERPGWAAGSGLDAGALAAWLRAGGTVIVESVVPRARAVAELAYRAWCRGQAGAPHTLRPSYLRDRVAMTEAERAAQGRRR